MKIPLEKLSLDSTLLQISNSVSRISQEPWYLKIVSKNNYLLQTEDYQFIFPIKSRFGIHQSFIPPFIQRVDPISKKWNNDSILLPNELIDLFPCGLLSFSK